MSWRENDMRDDFLSELYGEDQDEECEEDQYEYEEEPVECDVHINEDEEEEGPSSSILASLELLANDGGNRDRSRSPIGRSQPSTSNVVIRTFDNDGRSLYNEDKVVQDEYMTPDAHALYVSNEDEDLGEVDVREKNLRVRGRSGRRVRASQVRGRGRVRRNRGAGRRRRGDQPRWEVGRPLEEIWITDDDVPLELRELAREVVKKREFKALKEAQARNGGDIGNDDEFQDAMDERGNPVNGQSRFEWSPVETFRPREEPFTSKRTGSVGCHMTPYSAFRCFWDDSIIEQIVEKTNQYASQKRSASFQNIWYDTNAHEVLCLFAFWMMLGIIRMPTINSCFSTDPLLRTTVFSKIFTYQRYTTLSGVLHFADPDGDPGESDPLYSAKPIIDHLNAKFKENYVPSKDVCIDESHTLWMGPLNFAQYKATKGGIKTFELCESATGYLWSFIVSTENTYTIPCSKVLKLMGPLVKKGYRLFMDNCTPSFARYLKRNGTDCVGTLLPDCVDIPAYFAKAALKQGQFFARHSGDICVLFLQDNKRFNMLSTCHSKASGLAHVPSRPGARPLHFKPQVLLDYSRSMGGVNMKDEMLEPYLLERKKGARWYMTFFKRLLNVSILNSRILMESSLQCRQDHLNFRLRLVDEILTTHLAHRPMTRRKAAPTSRIQDVVRVVPHIHWPVRVDVAQSYATTNRMTRVRCNVCTREGRKDTKTRYKCEACDVPLCIENCFKTYHIT